MQKYSLISNFGSIIGKVFGMDDHKPHVVGKDDLAKNLAKDIDETLARWENETDLPGDGYNILRWSRKGYLVRKEKE